MTRKMVRLPSLLAIVIGVMAISASSAQALTWLVLNRAGEAIVIQGNPVNLLVKLAIEKDSQDQTLLAKTLGIPIVITCGNLELLNIHLATLGRITTGRIKYTECEAYESAPLTNPLSCNVHTKGSPSGTIETNEIEGELVSHELGGGKTEVLVKIQPVETTFATILTELCVLPTSNKISGVYYVKDCQGFLLGHLQIHLLEQGPLTSLVYGADSTEHLETSVTGSWFVRLIGEHAGLFWGAML